MQLSIFCVLFYLLVERAEFQGIYQDDTKFDVQMREIINTKYNGDPSVLNKFLFDSQPKSTRTLTVSPSYCFDIAEPFINDMMYSECTAMSAKSNTVLSINTWTGFSIFNFATNLLELTNVEIRMEHRSELTYLYFTVFRKCDHCLFNITKSPALVGLQFAWFGAHKNIAEVPEHHRARLYVRGNSQFEFRGNRRHIFKTKVCNPEMCVLQPDKECYFRRSIRKSEEYESCTHVYGNMYFLSRFTENEPHDANFFLDGCFVFNRTGIRFIRPMLKAHTNCPHQHIFEENKFMCTDQIHELRSKWGAKKVRIVTKFPPIDCYQGQCRGGFVAETHYHRFVGCEILQGDVHVSQKSGNLSDRIQDLSDAHEINGQLQLVGNPSITHLTLPYLQTIKSAKCPALTIRNMKYLRNVIFHPQIEFVCQGKGPAVKVVNCPNLFLHHQMIRQMTKKDYYFDSFDYDTNKYFYDNVSLLLIFFSCLLVAIVEITALLRNNLLLPNFIYRLFPIEVRKMPRKRTTLNKK